MESMPSVALALGAGGARGYAHIGAIEVLRERGYRIAAIAGTSMGALVGAVAAAGKLDDYTEWARSLTQRDVLRLLDVAIVGPGAFRAERVIGKVSEILDGAQIEDLDIPYTAVATDLDARREVWFQHGPLDVAIRASIAIPSVITPIMVGGRMLVDGGLMNPVPIEPTRATMTDFTVAISLFGMRNVGPGVDAGPESPVRETSDWADRLRHGAATILDWAPLRRPREPETLDPNRLPKHVSTIDVFNRSFDTMAALIARYRMASNPPDVLVSVPSDACRTMDFHRANEMIALGRELTIEALDAAGR